MLNIKTTLFNILDQGGPVVAILMASSVLTLALVLYKIWQYHVSGVGRHKALGRAIAAWDAGDQALARRHLGDSTSYLVPVFQRAFDGITGDTSNLSDRSDAEAEERFSRLEGGLNVLDMVAQLAPLLGLFGTVLGMIDAFRNLQNAGNSVDPSLLAGGIWVALLTTAAGLVVAMPTSLVLGWFEARMRRERVFANRALRTVFSPCSRNPGAAAAPMQADVAGQIDHGR